MSVNYWLIHSFIHSFIHWHWTITSLTDKQIVGNKTNNNNAVRCSCYTTTKFGFCHLTGLYFQRSLPIMPGCPEGLSKEENLWESSVVRIPLWSSCQQCQSCTVVVTWIRISLLLILWVLFTVVVVVVCLLSSLLFDVVACCRWCCSCTSFSEWKRQFLRWVPCLFPSRGNVWHSFRTLTFFLSWLVFL